MKAVVSLPDLIQPNSKHTSIQLSLLFGPRYNSACDILDNSTLALIVPGEPHSFYWSDLFTNGSLPFLFEIIVREKDSYYNVDLQNWYCPCTDYQKCYTDPLTGGTTRIVKKENYQVEENIIVKILNNCPSKLVIPLPICQHLLAILIAGIQKLEVRVVSKNH